jgi:endonuclease YncB( thermonuclease family)
LLLVAAVVAAYYYAIQTDRRETISIGSAATGQKIAVADGDSFAVGPRKMRLTGIDAPEYRQNCIDESGRAWPCGKTARLALEKILLEPELSCVVEISDKYARELAICKTAYTPDIAADQVSNGMAVSHEFADMRDYGAQEDRARAARLGIWRGTFERPELWRAANKRSTGNQ